MHNDPKFRNQKGAAIVEFAIVLPILLLLAAGIIEFSLLLYNQQVITNASREGARAGINPLPAKLEEDEIQTIVTNYIDTKLITFGNTPQPPTVTVTGAEGDLGEDVTVGVEFPYTFLLPNIIGLGPSIDLNAQTVMRMM